VFYLHYSVHIDMKWLISSLKPKVWIYEFKMPFEKVRLESTNL